MDVLSQTALLLGVTSFALGSSVLARNTRNKLFLLFGLLCFLIAGWAMTYFLHQIWPEQGYQRFHLALNSMLAPVALALIRVMVPIHSRFSQKLFWLSLGLAAGCLLLLLLKLDLIPIVHYLITYSPGLILIEVVHLVSRDSQTHRNQSGDSGQRRKLIYGGALVVLLTSTLDHVPWLGQIVPSFGNIILVVYLYFLSQAVSHQRLLNFSALLNRFLVLLVVAFLLSLVYSVMVVWVGDSPGLFFLNSFLVSFLVVMILDPLRALIGYFTKRMMSPKHQKLEEFLNEEKRKLTGIVDQSQLFRAILSVIQQTLHPQSVSFYMLRGNGTRFFRVQQSRTQTGLSSEAAISGVNEVLANQSILLYVEDLTKKGRFPVLLDQVLENEVRRSAVRRQRDFFLDLIEELKALEGNLLIPLISSNKLLGFLVAQVVNPPEPWQDNWGVLSVIYPYFEHAAQSMQRMEIYARAREKERLATLGQLSAGLAHEIRNPLGAIKGAAQFLDPSQDRPESKFLNIIIEETDRLNAVVTQFLDYSKPPVEVFSPVNLGILAEKTVETMRPIFPKGVRVSVSYSNPSGAYWVDGSAQQLQQVLINMIQNSLKALSTKNEGEIRIKLDSSREGSPFVRNGPEVFSSKRVTTANHLVARRRLSSHEEIFLSVEDNGTGIQKEHLDKLFIPFFTTRPEGTGLGLPISQKIIESHHGRIEVTSDEGRFTRFTIVMPEGGSKKKQPPVEEYSWQ